MSNQITKSTIARIAGNLLSGVNLDLVDEYWVKRAVARARAIAAEVEATEPPSTHASLERLLTNAPVLESPHVVVAERTSPVSPAGSPAADGGAVADVRARQLPLRCMIHGAMYEPAVARVRYEGLYGSTVFMLCAYHMNQAVKRCVAKHKAVEIDTLLR